ncbi:nucleotide sugar dehydrogenase [Couchioplanes caeruleus]|nr:nucleotide sugar dehydrogenase [Couchioplanes caeruleus]
MGYVGLPTALQLHSSGRRVLGVDISTRRLDAINSEDVDLIPRDRVRLKEALNDPWAFVMSSAAESIADAAAILICVPTPVNEHLLPDLNALVLACQSVVKVASKSQTLILTSTTYVGCTNDLLLKPLADRGLTVGRDIFVAFAPERINPGDSKIHHNDVPRVVGGATPACMSNAVEVLADCSKLLHPVSSLEAAEMTKLFENTFRAVNISLANEFADISGHLDLDINEVIDAAATKPYGFMPFRPGPGIGGHCIPCDPHYLLWQLRAERVTAPMIETAMALVASRPSRVVERAAQVLATQGKTLAGASVLIVGVAYKPGVADVRESPALEIFSRLHNSGAAVAFTDCMIDRIDVHGTMVDVLRDPREAKWDLVVVHTIHSDEDVSWLTDDVPVLDTTYRLSRESRRYTL